MLSRPSAHACAQPSLPLSALWHLCALSLALSLAACGGGGGSGAGFFALPGTPGTPTEPGDPPPPPPPARIACAALAGMSVEASRIGVASGGAVVTEATPVAAADAGNTLGEHCRVRGRIAPVNPGSPVIEFAVNLPRAWNGKAIHFGGGGFNGRLIDGTEPVRFGLPDKPAPLALGYATYGSDSGHQSSSITDARFALDDESLANYGGLALKKTRDVAIHLIEAHYGSAPKKAYFLGTSTGGRDALRHIQHWPQDYDGVVANEPALNYTGTRLSNVAVGRALYNNGGAGWLNVAKTLLVQRTALQTCDALDGASDGIVSNVEGCRQLNAQVLASLRCSGGVDTGDSCLSDAQLATVRAIESPLEFTHYELAHGVRRAGGYNLLEGALVAGPYTSRDLGTRPVPANPATSADANMYVTGDQWAKFFVARDPGFDTLGLDPLNPGLLTERVRAVSALSDATNPDLAPFLARGGRLILLHGLADEVISPNSTIDYYQRLNSTLGEAAVREGVRFYLVPGMGHGTGVFLPAWDSLAALEGWVENGLAPATGTVMDTVAGTFGRTRPLCEYPSWPRYRGSGSQDAAINFSCTSDAGNPLSCPHLPAAATRYKGGNTLGEELSVQVDPQTLAYTVTIDASSLRAAGAQRSGTLMAQGPCTYASAEGGASFTFAAGGLLQGGVAGAGSAAFAPLVAFENTFDNAAAPTDFRSVAAIFNAVGTQQGSVHSSAVRLRNAGTFQYCRATASGGFVNYEATCPHTEKGYIRHVPGRGAFEVYTTPAGDGATTTGGTLSGSMVIGLVEGLAVPVHLVRESGAASGLRLMALQQSLAAGAADGRYAMADSSGGNGAATVAASSLNVGGVEATLSFDTPVPGVAQAGASRPGHLVFNQGLIGFVPSSGTGPALELGVRH
ncbi:tannase/feruloyl esterase family alpha/beta hydrolase [Xenophilus arseniciresistens]|uniref:Tannase/feruloyl esterase family alpha/beta hydrolase n=1 Tax=Xenophilus arseniciresistens TaxID=1283306 RepID=A0AAE3NBS1_9BURK|nr:tannase/feruloyl esterase family alpha/beta hydrolase [Xenophilus arseniciresistens]MDA7418653.1 tannase/feruloyl esterase family alpha/beta hydrolase [Xenophilus arseniciresistens]